ncbi:MULTISPECIES: heat-inducible transcriptional repressor HrcA [Kosmotoga]|uniref:Heat-inducible transcription repressor HrcA n=1 Tax=Kosmotoga olearia (strain ATCC BAA-1733 / DSM 21960 / TBF 19.5.1) TaxID=521045 RepID=C5CDR5_KOSOT|nr:MULTISPECIES: heat-inducible transcriptional repressor HrcA [Kosmotoga]ACR80077.1 heat-inducible transcription repressor HrcA [Kosmotoga olearia TBF 19.5.1]MDI3523643.1 heat-inducible transcriptional repressor [Kosmotoga sp.]MDK2953535.1 heat-inducible transcriptional repressor [Kosmotoga sp.]
MPARRKTDGPKLNDRQVRVLYCITREYITHGKPVSSKQVLERSDLMYSSATIRNDMRKLEFLGYIYQPHTSAGRIPTDKGLRFYLESIKELNDELKESSAAISLRQVSVIGDIEHLLMGMARIIAKVSSAFVMVERPDIDKLVVKHVAISPVTEGYLNVTVVTDLGVTVNSTVFAGYEYHNYLDLQKRVNSVVAGKTIGEIREGLRNFKLVQEQWYSKEIEELFYFLGGVFENDGGERYYKYGLEYLVTNKNLGWQDISGLVKYIENPRKLEILMSKFSEVSTEKVLIGNEIEIPELKNFALFVAPYKRFSEKLGMIVIMASKINLYETTYAYLRFASNRLSEAFSKR